jgi:hypothetical protein
MNTIKKLSLILILISLVFAGCGDPSIEVDDSQYKPKIVVEGYLFAGETVRDIKISRNFKIGEKVTIEGLRLDPVNNNVTVTLNDIPLNYDTVTKSYYNNNILVDYNKTYTIKISAVINGENVVAQSTTTTPAKGFKLLNKDLGNVRYNSEDGKFFYQASPGTSFYAFSFLADSASTDNFIYDNTLYPGLKPKDVQDNMNAYFYQAIFITDINSYLTTPFSYTIQPFDAWFYSKYRVIAYAGDQNFRSYVFTAKNVQEFDGNFHEPKILFVGDGIGVFASAIRDTATFTLIPAN